MAGGLSISLLGGFRIAAPDGAPLRLGSRKHQALLAYLAVQRGKSIRRDHLMNLLWGKSGERQARHSLAQALYKIRQLSRGASALVIDDDTGVRLNDSAVALDLDQVTSLAQCEDPASLRQAADLCSGPVLDGLDLEEEPYAEWLRGLREQVRDEVIDLHLRLCALLIEASDYRAAAEVARKGLQHDPLNEDLHRQLFRALSACGREIEALRRYRHLRVKLKGELGVEPAAETVGEVSRILQGRDGGNGRATSVGNEGIEPQPTSDSMPTIAVHPFELLSSPPDNGHLAKGIAEDIAAELSRFHCLAVLAADAIVDESLIRAHEVDLTERLGGSHCLRGSLQVSETAYRLKVQLLEVATRRLIWSERYDIRRAEIFEAQDEVVAQIVSTLFGRLIDDRTGGARQIPTNSLAAYDCVLRGLAIHRSGHLTQDEARQCLAWFDRALELDPNYGRAHAWRACAAYHLWPEQPSQSHIERNMQSVSTALTIDSSDSEAHRIKGILHAFQRQFEPADHHLDKARELNPNDAMLLVKTGLYKSFLGDHAKGLGRIDLAMRRNPLHPDWYWRERGIVLFGAGAYDEAIEALRLCEEGRLIDHVYQAATLAALGALDLARDQVERVRRLRGEARLNWLDQALPYRCYKETDDFQRLKRLLEAANAQ